MTDKKLEAYNQMTDLEKWFCMLPNNGFGFSAGPCHCGSGKPLIYWSREESWACEDCKHIFSIYMPQAVMWNIAEKFGIPREIMKPVYDQIKAQMKKADDA